QPCDCGIPASPNRQQVRVRRSTRRAPDKNVRSQERCRISYERAFPGPPENRRGKSCTLPPPNGRRVSNRLHPAFLRSSKSVRKEQRRNDSSAATIRLFRLIAHGSLLEVTRAYEMRGSDREVSFGNFKNLPCQREFFRERTITGRRQTNSNK